MCIQQHGVFLVLVAVLYIWLYVPTSLFSWMPPLGCRLVACRVQCLLIVQQNYFKKNYWATNYWDVDELDLGETVYKSCNIMGYVRQLQ